MEIVYFTLVAALLYLLSNWIVDRLEVAVGRRLSIDPDRWFSDHFRTHDAKIHRHQGSH